MCQRSFRHLRIFCQKNIFFCLLFKVGRLFSPTINLRYFNAWNEWKNCMQLKMCLIVWLVTRRTSILNILVQIPRTFYYYLSMCSAHCAPRCAPIFSLACVEKGLIKFYPVAAFLRWFQQTIQKFQSNFSHKKKFKNNSIQIKFSRFTAMTPSRNVLKSLHWLKHNQ